MRSIGAAVCLACAVPAAMAGLGQTPAPSFTTGVALVTVEASVFDKAGRPVADLRPDDFRARVDGKPRRVVFARFYREDRGGRIEAPPASAAEPAPAHQSNAATTSGRVVVFVIDQESIRPGSARPAIDTIARLVDSLGPADAVGLLGLPTLRVELTRDHARVREALDRIVGTEPQTMWRRYVSIEEAEAILRDDKQVRARVVERECAEEKPPPGMLPLCPPQIDAQAQDTAQMAQMRVQTVLTALGNLVQRLKAVRGPKHLVLLSGGIPFGQESLTWYQQFAREAAEADIVLYALHVDRPEFDAGDRKPVSSVFGDRTMTQGLSSLAGMTGGGFFSAVGKASGAFGRIQAELDNFYQLGIESAPGDADGKAHKLELSMTRADATVRSRREIVRATPRVVADRLADTLRQPVDVGDLPIAVATYSVRGDDPAAVKVLMNVDIGSGAAREPVDWGFVVTRSGTSVADGRLRLGSTDATASTVVAASRIDASTNVQVPPGSYRIRFAAVDAEGRDGSIEIPVIAQLHTVGPLQMSDLVVGSASGNRMTPHAALQKGSGLVVVAEAYAADPEAFGNADATLMVAAAGGGEPAASRAIELSPTSVATVRSLQGNLATDDLAPGPYVATIVVRVGGSEAGRVSRAIEIF